MWGKWDVPVVCSKTAVAPGFYGVAFDITCVWRADKADRHEGKHRSVTLRVLDSRSGSRVGITLVVCDAHKKVLLSGT